MIDGPNLNSVSIYRKLYKKIHSEVSQKMKTVNMKNEELKTIQVLQNNHTVFKQYRFIIYIYIFRKCRVVFPV